MCRFSLGICCLLTGLVAGCVHYQSQPLNPERQLEGFQNHSLADPALRAYLETNLHREFTTWPPAMWDLQTLTFAAFYFHPDLAAARARLAVANAGQVTAGQSPNPTISVSPAYNTTTATPSPWLVTANLDVPIETAGKRSFRLAQARHLSDAARLGIATTAWDVRTRLRQALLELWSAEQTTELLKQQQTAQEEIVRLLEAALATGLVSQAEVTRERINYQQMRLSLVEAQNRQTQSRIRVAEAVGVPAETLKTVVFSLGYFNQATAEILPTEARRRALLNRADVLAAVSEYAAIDAALRLEIAKQYPDVHLSPGYEYDQGDNKWGLGLSVELPVLSRNQGPIAEAEARRRESAAKFAALQAKVLAEIESAQGASEAARKKLAATAALLEQLDVRERQAKQMFEAGEVSRQAIAAARLEKATAALSQLDARVKAQEALGQLESALQTPFELPESLFNVPAPAFAPGKSAPPGNKK